MNVIQQNNIIIYSNIPLKWKSDLDKIANTVIERVYMNFNFHYYNFGSFSSDELNDHTIIDQIDKSLFNFLTENKFITYQIIKTDHLISVFTTEKHCFIFESNDEKIITLMLKNKKVTAIVNISPKIVNNKLLFKSEDEDISNFYEKYKFHIVKNEFVTYTISSVASYLIRRYYYPSNYFKDQSFFIFDNEIDLNETKFNDELLNIVKSTKIDQINSKIQILKKQINEEMKNDHIFYIKTHDFNKKDFLELKTIQSISKGIIKLVLYLPKLYPFILKEIYSNAKSIEREVFFCENYSHRCFTKFYGFIKDNDEIHGFVYKYMNKGTLENCILKENNMFFKFTSLIRLVQGLGYLQSNGLIHRDLKPSNILVDNDKRAYISDYETIRPIGENQEEITRDIGIFSYKSPEQDSNSQVTLKSDIYTFGALLFYIFENKNIYDDDGIINEYKEKQIYPEIKNCSENIRNLYKLCVKYDPAERPDINYIINAICEETKTLNLIENYCLQHDEKSVSSEQIIEYFRENIILRMKAREKLLIEKYLDQIAQFHLINITYQLKILNQNISNDYLLVTKDKYSETLFLLGDFYCERKEIKKAIEYYELSIKQNNLIAIIKLGNLYYNGVEDKLDILKAKENYPEALLRIGYLYLYGQYVEQDHLKAKEYFELAEKSNNTEAMVELGKLYYNGKPGNNPIYNAFLEEVRYVKNEVIQDYSKAKEYFEKGAMLENTNAYVWLGTLYEKGLGVQQDYDKAREYYEFAAGKNNSEALVKLGALYYNGYGVEKDIAIAEGYWEIAKEMGNHSAILNLLTLYNEVNPDIIKSVETIQSLSEQKDLISDFMIQSFNYGAEQAFKTFNSIISNESNIFLLISLGNNYRYGFYSSVDYAKARYYYEKAAEQNNLIGLKALGQMYFNGEGVYVDYQKSMMYFKRSAELYDSESIYMLGVINYHLNYFQKAKTFFEESAKQKIYKSYAQLGRLYLKGYGVKADYEKAMQYFKEAEKHNDEDGIFYMGYMYYYGKGVNTDYSIASKYFKKIPNNSSALYKLGNIYYKGRDVPIDPYQARYYYEKSAKSEYPDAYIKLGDMYAKGIGFILNLDQAKHYYEMAKELKFYKAYSRLGNMYKKGLGVKQNYKKAFYYYSLASRHDNKDALYYLGFFYEFGLGTNVNISNAIKYYRLAASNFTFEAVLRLEYIYLIGKGVFVDISKCINYLKRAIYDIDKYYHYSRKFRKSGTFYIINNDLGLIYLIIKKKYEKALSYIKEAALNEYPFGQNNYGLYSQFFSNEIEKAKDYFILSLKNKFALASYNLGYIYEKEKNFEKSIEYYIKASEYENQPLIFRQNQIIEEQLEISKVFILCLTNLKLTYHYLNQGKISESKEYFIKSLIKIMNNYNDYFLVVKVNQIYHNEEYLYSFLHDIIFKFPDFDLSNDNDDFKKKKYSKNKSIKDKKYHFQTFTAKEKVFNGKLNSFNNEEEEELEPYEEKADENKKILFSNASEFFDFVTQNREYKIDFIKEIHNVIDEMSDVLYTSPYAILFGRIQNRKQANKVNNAKKINQLFYEGFEN